MAASATSSEHPELRAQMAALEARLRLERARNLGLGLLFAVLFIVTYRATEFSPLQLLRSGNMGRILVGFLHPDFSIVRPGSGSFAEGLVPHFVLQTLAEAVLGTSLGAFVAVPLSFLAAGNLMRRHPLGAAVYFVTRALMSIIRSVPTIFWGILFVTSIGLGPFTGVLAITIFSVGLVSKLFSEAIEAIDLGQVDALTATGANSVQVLVHGVVPQVLPYLVAHLLYTFEVNVHSATILGLIGAGGIGFLFLQYVDQFQYSQEAMVLIVVILVTVAIDNFSATVRRRII